MNIEEYQEVVSKYRKLRRAAEKIALSRLPEGDRWDLHINLDHSDVYVSVREWFGESTESCYPDRDISISLAELFKEVNKSE